MATANEEIVKIVRHISEKFPDKMKCGDVGDLVIGLLDEQAEEIEELGEQLRRTEES